MASVEIITAPPVLVEIVIEGAAPLAVHTAAPVLVEVIIEGTQGPSGVTVVQWSGSDW